MDEATFQIRREINLHKTMERDMYTLIALHMKEFWFGRSHAQLIELTTKDKGNFRRHLKRVMREHPSIFYIPTGNGNIYYDWTRIPIKYRQALKENAEAGYVTVGLRRSSRGMVEKIPLGINSGPDLSMLWDYNNGEPETCQISTGRHGNTLHSK